MIIILVLQHLNPRGIAEIYAFVRIQFLLRQHWLLSLLNFVLHKMLHIDLTSNLTSSLEVNEEIINKSKDKKFIVSHQLSKIYKKLVFIAEKLARGIWFFLPLGLSLLFNVFAFVSIMRRLLKVNQNLKNLNISAKSCEKTYRYENFM